MLIKSQEAEKEAALNIAKLMLVSARTAPKAGGRDSIVTAIIDGPDLDKLADEMERIGKESNQPGRIRDAKNVRDSEVVVLIGVKYESGSSNELKLIDLGIALGSAVKTASELNADNRIMRSVGLAAKNLSLLDADHIEGIPVSIKGKNIYFDRPAVTTQ
jgi:uncharacterized ferredoxin-like protein